MHIPLPPSINPTDRSPEAARLRLVVPSWQIGPFHPPVVGTGSTVSIGANRSAIMTGWTTVEARVDETYLLFAMKDKGGDIAVLVDTPAGPRQVLGYDRAFIDAVRLHKFGRAVAPVPVEPSTRPKTTTPVVGERLQLTDDDLDRIVARSENLKTTSEPTTPESDRLAAVVDALDGKTYSEPETAETFRLVELAATLDDETAASGGTEVDRLIKLADSLTDG